MLMKPFQRFTLRARPGEFKHVAIAAMLAFHPVVLAGCVAQPAAEAQAGPDVVGPAYPAEQSVAETGVFGDQTVDYVAALEWFDISVGNDRPDVRLAAVSYTAGPSGSEAERPVLFAFNGGPISPSLWLHMGALGPKRVSAPDDLSAPASAFTTVDNPAAPLDVADIVFFDPASTGFSHVVGGGDPRAYYSVEADAAQFVAFVEAWLARHGRENSPVFILGESYGTMRAAEAAGQLTEAGKPPAGVHLMGQAVNIIEYSQRPQNIISFVVSLPTIAAMGWEQDRVDRKGRNFETFMADAEAFGESDYLLALFQGNELGEAERERIAARLQEFTGIPAQWYLDNRLRITKEQYRVELMRDEGKVMGRSDGRYIGTDLRGDASAVLQEAYMAGWSQYMSDLFGIEIGEQYSMRAEIRGLDDWSWGASSPFGHFDYSARIQKAFEANPDFRLIIGNGYHDTMTTVGAADYLVKQAHWPLDRVKLAYYPGGHMAYSIDSSAAAFGDDIRAWITGTGEWAEPAAE